MLVKMRRDDGHEIDVHPTMVDDYRKGGYQVTESPVDDDAKPRRGRPKKAAE